MNLTKLKERLLEKGKKIGLMVEEENKDSITLHSQITASQYFDNSIYFRIVVFASGTMHLFLTFDEMEKTYDNLFLINKYNENSPWFKGYITNLNGKDFFEIHFSAIDMDNEEQIVDMCGYLLTDVLGEESLKYLSPIVNGQAN